MKALVTFAELTKKTIEIKADNIYEIMHKAEEIATDNVQEIDFEKNPDSYEVCVTKIKEVTE